ncbi:MAG TPA: APC family permease [Candidatus Limnocylindrales bacterium]|nr:APC family permease [Candidatus Limnocylindrales bacterium]
MTTDVGMFTRRSTGLTREAGTASTLIYNINFVSIGLMMMFAVQLIPSFYPGGDMIGSYILALVIVLPTSLAFSLLSAAMPRSGGDYVFVSRILGPRAGMTSSWVNTIWWFIYGGVPSAFLARYALGPLFRSLGLMTDNPSLVQLGDWFITPEGTIVTGTILIAALVFVFARGLGVYFKIQNVLFALAVLGLAVAAFMLLTGNADTFTANFNSYWNSQTGQADTHQAVIDAAVSGGFAEAPFDLYWTLIPITWIYLELVFCQSSAYIGGEVRQASRVQLWSMPVAAIISVGVAIVVTLLLQNVIGTTFLGAVGWDPYLADTAVLGLPFAMPFSELVAYLSASPIVALLLGVGFVFWSYTWLPGQIANASRNLLAYGIDGVLPERFGSVSDRFHTPVFSLVVTGLLSVAALVVYATNPDFTTLVGIVAFIVSFIFVSIAAIFFPYRRRELWASSPVSWTVAGLPVISIVGVLSLIACLVAEWCYLSDPLSGVGVLANGFFGEDGAPTKDFVRLLIAAGTVVSGWVVYEVSRWYRSRQGVQLDRAFAEIPVE